MIAQRQGAQLYYAKTSFLIGSPGGVRFVFFVFMFRALLLNDHTRIGGTLVVVVSEPFFGIRLKD